MTEGPIPPGSTTDGRHLRRQRGRAAALEGLIELLFEGVVYPTAKQIAERAGLSHMSVHRYFDGVEDLRNAAVVEWFSRHPDLLDIEEIGVGDRAGRIERLVSARLRLYETGEPLARMFRIRAIELQAARDRLAVLHHHYVDQIRKHFDAELALLDDDAANRLVAMAASLTSFEAWDLVRQYHDMDHDEIFAAWTSSLTALIHAA